MELRLHDFEDCYIDKDTLETSDVIEGGAELFLYQTGYLTIKGFDEDGYSLGFPNEEVRKALYKAVDDRKVIGVAVELDDMGKGLIDWKEVK